MNVMQLIVHEPLLAIAFPANANFFLTLITGIVNFQIIPTDYLLGLVMEFSDDGDQEAGSKAEELGYSDENIIESMGTKLILLVFAVFLIILLLLVRKLLLCTAL